MKKNEVTTTIHLEGAETYQKQIEELTASVHQLQAALDSTARSAAQLTKQLRALDELRRRV